jgi:molybdopterin-biosynthesis enzyme MoeA-like protein
MTLKRTFAGTSAVFSFGGIGATPDDHTRECAARAAGVPLKLHPEAEAEIRARFGSEVTPQRLAMGEFPEGSAIVPNPYNRMPGFSLAEHYFLPGFPQMAWPMMEWVLDTRYKALCDPHRFAEASIIVRGAGESQLIALMHDTLARFPGLKVFSLPRLEPDRHIELGARGRPEEVAAAIALMQTGVAALGFPWAPATPPS